MLPPPEDQAALPVSKAELRANNEQIDQDCLSKNLCPLRSSWHLSKCRLLWFFGDQGRTDAAIFLDILVPRIRSEYSQQRFYRY